MKKLSKQEQKVLLLLAQGYKSRDIAKKMFTKKGVPLSEKTVGTYNNRVREKLGVPRDKNVFYLVQTAINRGVLSQTFQDNEEEPIYSIGNILLDIPVTKYISNVDNEFTSMDRLILGGLAGGLTQTQIMQDLKNNDIEPNSLSMIEKRIKALKIKHNCKNLFELGRVAQKY